MYIEESGSDLTVRVEGEECHHEASVDLDSDGLADTAIVETDDGSIAFTDTDADGQADLMTQLDADGTVVGQARFDEVAGEWVDVDTSSGPAATGQVGDPAGVPTHDTDGDGANDSTVTQGPDGEIMIFTDADEDGDTDYRTEIGSDGAITVSEHAPDGDWTVIEHGRLDEHGKYVSDSAAAAQESGWISPTEPDGTGVHTDPRTGGWVQD